MDSSTPPPAGPPPGSQPPPPPPGAAGPPPGAPFGPGPNTGQQGPPPSFSDRINIVRPKEGRLFFGVCAGLARATGTDPLLFRVILGVLCFFSGIGVLFYLIGILVLTEEGDQTSPVESLVGRGRASLHAAWTIVLIVVTGLVGLWVLDGGPRMVLLAAAAVVGLVMLVRRPPGHRAEAAVAGVPGTLPATAPTAHAAPAAQTTPAAQTAPVPAQGGLTKQVATEPAPSDQPSVDPNPTEQLPITGGEMHPAATAPLPPYQPPYAPHGPFGGPPPPPPPVPPRAPKPPKEKSVLTRIVLSLALIAVGLVAVLVWATQLDWTAYFAVPLAVIGLGLLVGTFFGRARGMIWIGLVLSALLLFGVGLNAAHTELNARPPQTVPVTWSPATAAQVAPSYQRRYGEATLDLRHVAFAGQKVSTDVGMTTGSLKILLPPTVDVQLSSKVSAGDALLLGKENSGVNLDTQFQDNGSDGPGGGTLTLAVTMGAGEVEVIREAA
jgi:phage shock protein PspC (stress-responsive transcriptional regulator)